MSEFPVTTTALDHPQSGQENSSDLWERIRTALNWQQTAAVQAADPVVLTAKLAARARSLRARTEAKSTDAASDYLAFHNGHERYGIRLSEVIEIQTLEHFSPVPRMPSEIAGVIQWRGSILALLNISKLLGVPQSGIADYHACVIVEGAGHKLAVVAGEVEAILHIPATELKTAPQLANNISAEWLLGIHAGNRLLLNMDQILRDERFIARRKSQL